MPAGLAAAGNTVPVSVGGAGQSSRSAVRAVLPASNVTRKPGQVFTTAMAGTFNAGVRAWQARMTALGYSIAVDGHYGPQSAAACRRLQQAKGLAVDGVVGDRTWAATFA